MNFIGLVYISLIRPIGPIRPICIKKEIAYYRTLYFHLLRTSYCISLVLLLTIIYIQTMSKKAIVISASLIGILLILLLAIFIVQRKNQNTARTAINNTDHAIPLNPKTISKDIPNSSQRVTVPPLTVQAYTFQNKPVTPPTSLAQYSLKSNYTRQEVDTFAQSLGLQANPNTSNNRYLTYYNLTDINNKGFLVFDRVTGAFVFQSLGNFSAPLSISGQSPQLAGTLITRQLGFDDTVTCTHTYQRSEYPDYVYIECNRDWTLAGLPILGLPGVLTIDPNTSVNTLQAGDSAKIDSNDPSVVGTNNNTDGKSRNTDFNALTIVLSSSTNRVIEIRSNLRKIDQKTVVDTAANLRNQESVRAQLEMNNSPFSLSLPAGSPTLQGLIPWQKIYQKNTAIAQKATVTDMALTYLENPATTEQHSLTPYYLVRGTAQLTTGYTVNFIQAIPALNNEVAGISTLPDANAKTQKQGTIIESSVTPTPSTITLPSPTTPPPSDPVAGCVKPTDTTELSFTIPGLGNLQFYYLDNNAFKSRELYFKSQSIPFESINKTRELLYIGTGDTLGPIAQQYLIFAARELTSPTYLRPAATIPTTIAEAKNFLKQLATTTGPGPYGRMNGISTNKCTNAIRNSLKAPPVLDGIADCTPAGWYDLPLLHSLAERVATALVQAGQNNTLSTIAAQPNLFPESILTDFEQILYSTTDTTSGVGEGVKQQLACRVTGSSPRIYVYSEKTEPIQIQLSAPITYQYPQFNQGNTWNIQGVAGGLHTVYYEYNPTPISLTKQASGFVIAKNDLENFITHNLAVRLQLTSHETEDMVIEVRNTLLEYTQPYSYITVRLADSEELDQKLPLQIKPQPEHLTRVHLLLQPITTYVRLNPPSLTPIQRTGLTVLEIGARLIQ